MLVLLLDVFLKKIKKYCSSIIIIICYVVDDDVKVKKKFYVEKFISFDEIVEKKIKVLAMIVL